MKRTVSFRLIGLGAALIMLLAPLGSQATTGASAALALEPWGQEELPTRALPAPVRPSTAVTQPEVSSQDGRIGPADFEIGLQSRQFTPDRGVNPAVQAALENAGEKASAQGAGRVHTILQLEYIPTPEEKEQLRQQGIELLTYIPNYAWLASVPAANPAEAAGVPGVRWVGTLTAQDKLQPELRAQELQPWAYDPAGNLIAVLVQFHKDVDLEQGRAAAEAHGGEVTGEASVINTLAVEIDRDELAALAGEDVVAWIEQPLPLLEPVNDGNRARVGADTLQTTPYNLDGTNVDVLVYDGGRVYSHTDLDSRRTYGDSSGFSEHATHVACTLLGSGAITPTYLGMAPNADLLSMGHEGYVPGLFLYTNPGDIQNDLNYAKNTWSPSADLVNVSLGTNLASNGFACSIEGNYGATSQLVDAIVRGSLGEPFIAAWANGNERLNGRCGTSYHTTAPPACAKNPIHSGATRSADDSMSTLSSWGPCDDGRLKPTISSPGIGVISCDDSNDYQSMSGTSMASPTTAGVIALMLEQYRATYSTSGEFLPSMAKALLIHTAVDLGNTGPDYQFGYGRIDGVAAVDAIIARELRQGNISTHGQVDEYSIIVSGSPSELRVSLAWDDPPGSLAAIKKLVNDLDLRLEAPDGTLYYPWVLDPANPGDPATTGIDEINNQEQVVVSNPMNGFWKLRVTGTVVPDAPQAYSIIFPGAGTAPCTHTPGGGPSSPPPTSCSEALFNGGFEIGTAGWVFGMCAVRVSPTAHSGASSARLGGTCNGFLYQQISLPLDFHSGTLSYWVRMETSGTDVWMDFFDADIRDGSDNILTTVQSLNDQDYAYEGTWTQESFTLGSEYAGKTIRVRFGTDVDEDDSAYWYIDDVSLDACVATGGGNTPPIASDPPDQTVPSTGADDVIDLWAYAADGQDGDADLTFTIENTPDPNAGVSIDANRYIDVDPTPGWSGPVDVIVRVTDTGGLSDTGTFRVNVYAVAGFPFCDSFESGSLGSVWATYTTNEGRVQVSSSYPYSGAYSVLLDDSDNNPTVSDAAVILAVDLSGQSQVSLDFWWREFDDESHPEDGVFISDDEGASWHEAFSFNGGPSDFRNDVVDIDAAAAAHGLTLNDHFWIKFQFHDDYGIPTDGYAIDEVCVNHGDWETYLPLVLRSYAGE
jgi:subtilisin family serine protease